jgi:hypothetical protein
VVYGKIIELHLCENCPFLKNLNLSKDPGPAVNINRIQKLQVLLKEMEEAKEEEGGPSYGH